MINKKPIFFYLLFLFGSLLLGQGIISLKAALGFRHISNALLILFIPLIYIALQNSRSIFFLYLSTAFGVSTWVIHSLSTSSLPNSITTLLIFCGVFVVMREIVAHFIEKQRKAEAEIAIRENNYREIFNSTDEMIFVHDASTGEILDGNSQTLSTFDYTKEEMRCLTLDQIAAEPDPTLQEKFLFYVQKAKEGTPQRFEWRMRRKDGASFWVEVVLRFTILNNQERVLSVIRNISARKAMEAEREEMIKNLRQALDEITQLQKILPICCHCKNIRTDDGYWERVDQYLLEHFNTLCSHSICPECAKKHYRGLIPDTFR
ncbi:MAG: PAS domain S-box protein [bacterium]|jgi:PAS domain S-box-containing protein|nr:PAS domain S-box protein [bacterium]